ncbi:putative ribonuclease H-like domain-containing protein [Tanacetum coccineum]
MGWVMCSDAVVESCDAVLVFVVTPSRCISDAVSSHYREILEQCWCSDPIETKVDEWEFKSLFSVLLVINVEEKRWDYALWEVIEYGNSFKPVARTTTNAGGSSTSTIPGPVTTEEKMYKNFSASSQESLDSISNRLQKIVSQLSILSENISQEDLNFKFLRSLPSEWRMYVVIVEQEVKRSVTSSSNSSSQNVAFVSTPGSSNEDNTVNVHVNTASTNVSTASTNDSTASLSDATIYAFLANQPNGSQVVHEDLEQIHEDDLEQIDLKCQLALLSLKARKFYQRTGKKIIINGSDTAGYDKSKVECFNCHKMGHFARECRGLKNQDSRFRNQESSKRTVNVEDTTSKAVSLNYIKSNKNVIGLTKSN